MDNVHRLIIELLVIFAQDILLPKKILLSLIFSLEEINMMLGCVWLLAIKIKKNENVMKI